jgi:hypothetical protein
VTLLALRFLLAPCLVAAASLAARRWGDRAGGTIAALPFVAGPLLLVISLEHGSRFGADAASSALSGITALAVFAVGYAHLARAFRWTTALPLGWLLYLASASLMRPLETGIAARLPGALASLWLAKILLPWSEAATEIVKPGRKPSWDIPARMASAALLVGGIATLSDALGPAWSGLLAPFPIATTILVAFAHAQDGHKAVARMLEGFLPALTGLAIFFAVLASGLVRWGIGGGFALALGAALATQGVLVWIKPAKG